MIHSKLINFPLNCPTSQLIESIVLWAHALFDWSLIVLLSGEICLVYLEEFGTFHP